MKKLADRILYGGDYNPNQWPREIWDEDMEFFEQAHINSATVNVFSWAKLQPSEEVYDLSELDDIVAMLSDRGYSIVMGTSTAALPAWMVRKYPETARTDHEGRHHRFGQRHNACPNSPVYRKYAAALAGKLAERYAGNPHIACWHVSNEYEGECFCENCEKAFRIWLKKKYHTIEAVNKAWNMEFWGHTLYDWEDIVLPNALSEGLENDGTCFAGISVDYRRFNSDSILETFLLEKEAIRRYDPDTVITTNMMGMYKGLDYFKWAKELDIAAWDCYPAYQTPWSYVALGADVMRGLKNAPFMLMEQTPSQQNWQKYNSLKRPGQMRAQSYHLMAHGADTIQFFQLRRSVGGCEKFHGAVISHAGTTDTRVFREVAELGRELENLGTKTLGSVNEAQAGIIFDWDNYWAVEYTSGPSADLKYVKQIHEYYRYFYQRNIGVNVIPADGDFSGHKIIAAPLLYMMKDGMKEKLEEYVREGGTLVTTFMSGIVDQSDNVHLGGYPGPLRELAGIWVEEIDALPPEKCNRVVFGDGTDCSCNLLFDLIRTEGAECIGSYGEDFYAGMPAVTRNRYGKGSVWYVGSCLDEAGLGKVLDMACREADVKPVVPDAQGLEVVCRRSGDTEFYFVLNFEEEPKKIPAMFAGKEDLLNGKTDSADTVLKQFDVRLYSVKRF